MRALTACILMSLTACAAVRVDLPEQFLITSATSTEFKATTADDAIFWVQPNQLPKRGANLDFWVTALKKDFVDNRGYVLLEEEDIDTHTGIPGKQMVYETTTQGRPMRYLIAVFIQRGWWWSNPVAWTARFTAEKDQFDEQAAAIKEAIRTTRF